MTNKQNNGALFSNKQRSEAVYCLALPFLKTDNPSSATKVYLGDNITVDIDSGKITSDHKPQYVDERIINHIKGAITDYEEILKELTAKLYI